MPDGNIRLANGDLAVEIDPLGAELQSIASRDGTSWLWNGDPAFWAGRAPLMFPVVGHCRDGIVTIEGKAYPMEPHGFARRSRFEVTSAAPTHCSMRLLATAETRRHFPFDFALEVSFRLDGAVLAVEAVVHNLDGRMMPFTFRLPSWLRLARARRRTGGAMARRNR